MTQTWNRSWVRRAIVLAVNLKVAGLVLVVDWTGRVTNPFDLTKTLYSRSLEWALFALLLLAVAGWGLQVFPRTRLHYFVATIVVIDGLAVLFAPQPYLAIYGTQGRYLGLAFAIDMTVLYAAVAAGFRSRSDWIVLSCTLGVCVALSLVYAWVQYLGLDPLPWSMNGRDRPFSTIGNPNTYGHLLSVALPAAAAIAVTYRGPRPWPLRIVTGALAAAIVTVDGIVATRGTFLGLIAAAIAVPVLFLHARGTTRRAVVRLAGGLAVAVLFVIAVLAPSPLGARASSIFSITANLDRIQVWEAAARAFIARPILGFGRDSFGVAWPMFRPLGFAAVSGPGIVVDSAHDWILQTAATTGIFGLVAMFAALSITTVILIRRGLARDALVAGALLAATAGYWAHALVSVGTIGVDWVPWVAFGAATTFAVETEPVARWRLHPGAVLAPILAGIVAGAVGLHALEANRDSWRAREATDLNQAQFAIELATAAVGSDGGRADYWNELGRAYFIASRWSDSAAAFQEAINRAPHHAAYQSNLARALLPMALAGDSSRGGPDAALTSARRATEIDPNDPLPYVALAQVATALARPDIALSAAADAFVIYQDPAYEGLVTSNSSRVTDLASAGREIERALSAKDTARLRIALGNVALRQGDRATALDSARRALVLEPNNPAAQELIRAAGG